MHIKNCEESWQAIRAMNVRGAPAIAIAAALALAVETGNVKVLSLPSKGRQSRCFDLDIAG